MKKEIELANRLVLAKFKGKKVRVNKVAQTITFRSGAVYEYRYSARKQKVIYRKKLQ